MNIHQIDLRLGESVRLDRHTLTVVEIDSESQEVIFEVEDPDGSCELVPASFALQSSEELVLV